MVCDRDAQDVQGETAALSTMPTGIAFASFNAQVHLSRLIFRHITSLQVFSLAGVGDMSAATTIRALRASTDLKIAHNDSIESILRQVYARLST